MLTFNNPKEATLQIKHLNEKIHLKIEEKIKETLGNSSVIIPEDPYLGYPRLYSDDMRCTVMELKRIFVNAKGRVQLTTDEHSRIRQPHCENLSVGELIQLWDIVLKNKK